jgi:hypothetical protein
VELRYLNRKEMQLAQPVFRDSLPWFRIQLSPRVGMEDRPFTMGRTIHVGPEGFRDGMDSDWERSRTLIHELTHVWQYEHGCYGGSYIFSSGWAQATEGKKAYIYTLSKDWDKYNVEQQGEIVADWWAFGCSSTDLRYPYLRDFIWSKHIKPDDNEWNKYPESFGSGK